MSRRWEFDIYSSIRAVNWMRREVALNRSRLNDVELIKHLRSPFESGTRPAFLDADEYLQPYLPDDALLPALSCESWDCDEDRTTAKMQSELDRNKSSTAVSSTGAGVDFELSKLREENLKLKAVLDAQDALIQAVILYLSFISCKVESFSTAQTFVSFSHPIARIHVRHHHHHSASPLLILPTHNSLQLDQRVACPVSFSLL